MTVTSSKRGILARGLKIALVSSYILHSALAQDLTQEQILNTQRTMSIGYVVFPGFTPLDIFGPLELLFQLSYTYKISLATIAHTKGPISARPPPHRPEPHPAGTTPEVQDYSHILGPSLVATHTFEDAPALDVIIVPGGRGDFALVQANNTDIEQFLVRRFAAADYVLSVCTGAVSLARAGLLEGRRATTNKRVWSWATGFGKNVTWVPSARWVQDGKVWTSSGVAAGIDMTYAFLKHAYGNEKVDAMINGIEYVPHLDAHWDPFSVVHNVPGADKSRSLTDCAAPVGYSDDEPQYVPMYMRAL